jgi:hypothetical protein
MPGNSTCVIPPIGLTRDFFASSILILFRNELVNIKLWEVEFYPSNHSMTFHRAKGKDFFEMAELPKSSDNQIHLPLSATSIANEMRQHSLNVRTLTIVFEDRRSEQDMRPISLLSGQADYLLDFDAFKDCWDQLNGEGAAG